ncbi:MAG: amidohydrolase family protein [Flavobacteriales bacterium]|jgi:imidazolonepropionase-like amidohydrolase|nr:amidohydrolase family protein [Flavobacteriales bacterium]|tara:strand:+ start:15787 stop:17052 length:1266 start_codon:yes stop_codon:yes gene_type:complete
MNKKYLHLLFTALITITVNAQKPILFMGATAHLGNGEKIENAAISMLNGKIELVADASIIRIDPSAFDTIYRVHGKHLYPAFIVPNTTLGITEIDAVRASNDYDETGAINPNVRSLIAYNTDSKIAKTVRSNGVLIAQVTPRGGTISGQSSVMHLDGWNWEDAALRTDDGIHLNWPSSFYQSGWWAEPGTTKENKEYNESITKLKHFFKKANAYAKYSNLMDLQMESMKGLFNGNKTLYIHANNANDMLDAISFSNDFSITKTVIIGAEDALKIVDAIKENDISLILNRVHRLPSKVGSPVDEPFTQAAKLQDAGILFCLSYEGEMEAMGARNLPFSAGTAVAHGLDYEKAISSITLNTAQILGIDHYCGSIEKGKDATFFISSGDALDMRTNNVEKAYIQGIAVDLNNHQKELFNKYKNR